MTCVLWHTGLTAVVGPRQRPAEDVLARALKDHRQDTAEDYESAVTSTEDVLAPLREDQVHVVLGLTAFRPVDPDDVDQDLALTPSRRVEAGPHQRHVARMARRELRGQGPATATR